MTADLGSVFRMGRTLIAMLIGKEDQLLNELRKIEHVKEASMTYGVYDIVAKIEADTTDKLKEVLTSKVRKISGVKSTLTMLVVEGN